MDTNSNLLTFFRKLIPQKTSLHGRMAVRDRFMDLADRTKAKNPLIVDGGANTGSTIELFLQRYPAASIHAFEPIPNVVQVLTTRYKTDKRVTIHGSALGAENKSVSFNIVKNQVSSSILSPSDICRSYHGNKTDIEQTVEVQQVRLDDTLNDDIDILKLDLQGYELEALKGCGNLLDRIKLITTEIEFVPLYENQPLFADIDIFLRNKGFKLLNLYELWTQLDGQLTAGDAVYINNRFFAN